MNGAESLVKTLAQSGVDVCFANPGTSEMHFVAALDRVPGVRCVLALFEGVATGAADGYARMADKPAATLLHLGTGLTNGLANLHNAKRANTPIVNIVGEHATYHVKYDAPLTSDIRALAQPMSHWMKSAATSAEVGPLAAEAITVSKTAPGQIATLILPADTAWTEGGVVATAASPPRLRQVAAAKMKEAAEALRKGSALLYLGGAALRARPVEVAAAIAAKTGTTCLAQPRDPRIERGAGRAHIGRLSTATGAAVKVLEEFKSIVLVGARAPVSIFAHPGKPSVLTPDGCNIVTLAEGGDDLAAVLEALAEELGVKVGNELRQPLVKPDLAAGNITPEKLAQSLAAALPENAIVCDEAVTTGRPVYGALRQAQPHDYLALTGGAIGEGMPMATGAAIACPDRKVVTLQADGSAMYTVQALWTQACERLNILTILYANNSYAILRNELQNVGIANPGANAIRMLSFTDPPLGWVSIARGMGVAAERATTMEEFNRVLAAGIAHRGPFLIEVAVP